MSILESGENYLETILILQNQNGLVRSIDIANTLGYTKASISKAMAILKKNGYIKMQDNGSIILTDLGKTTANKIYDRHKIITQFFVEILKVANASASADACKIEHVISDEVFNAIKNLLQNKAAKDLTNL